MTDNETRPRCPAVLHMSVYDGSYRCELVPGHEGPHRDQDGDTWHITYMDEPGVSPQAIPFVMDTRPVPDQLTALTVRVGVLETLGARVDNLEQTSASGAATDDMFVGVRRRADSLERMFMALREDATRIHSRITGLEARLNPVCGHRDPSSGLVCQRPPDHYGEVHSTATDRLDGTVWSTEHREGQKRNEAVLIDPVELGKLREASERLSALEAAGVDNWEGYGHAMQIMRERSNG